MKITDEQLTRLAGLARLELDEGERGPIRAELGALLAYFEALEELDTSDVPPTAHVLAVDCRRRADRLAHADPASRSEALVANAPEHADGFFVVPTVIE